MTRLRPAARSSPTVARARIVLAVSAVLTLVPAGLLGAVLLQEPPWKPLVPPEVHHVAKGDGYLAYAELQGAGRHVSGWWTADGGVDRVMMVLWGDVDRLLAGEQPAEILQEWRFGGKEWESPFGPDGSDRGVFELRLPTCPTGFCTAETGPVLVWLKGDDWIGTPRGDLVASPIDYQGNDAMGGSGPVLFRQSILVDDAIRFLPWLAGAAALLGLVGLGAACVWLVAALRAPRGDSPPEPPFQDVGAAEMLRLVRLAEL